jgi:hypothetical protein
LKAKKHPVLVLCLGQDVELNIVPKLGFEKPESCGGRMTDSDHVEKDDFRDNFGKEDLVGDTIPSEGDPEVLASMAKPASSAAIGKARKTKSPAEDLRATLVHGDILLLSGDDFEVNMDATMVNRWY